jgi:urease accessory protein
VALSEPTSILQLISWLSPVFPVGSFSYSHGLERAVHDRLVDDEESLRHWVLTLLEQGSAWNDAVLFAEAWRRGRAGEPLDDLADLGQALAGSAERLLETTAQGSAFDDAIAGWGSAIALPTNCPYCLAVGARCGSAGIPLDAALCAFLQAFVSNQFQAGIRLSVIGQSAAVRLLSSLVDTVLIVARRAARSSLDDLGSSTLSAEIAAMGHETQYSRLFRT